MESPEPIQRKKCPFYGFMSFQGHLRDTGGSQCVFSAGIGWEATCGMEGKKEAVDFNLCSVIDSELKKRILEGEAFKDVWVYPREIGGSHFNDWMKYVMNRKENPRS